MSKTARVSVFVLAALGLLVLGWCAPWRGLLYRGDGRFLD